MTDNSVEAFLAEFRPPERIVMITTRGDLIGELDQLESELDRLREAGERDDSLGETQGVIDLAERITEIREQVRTTQRPFVVRSLGDKAWSDLQSAHPPTDEDKKEGLPWHIQTFWPAVLARAIESPKINTEQADKLLEVLSSGQARKLLQAVMETNGGDGDALPKSSASLLLRHSSTPKRRTASPEGFPGPPSLAES